MSTHTPRTRPTRAAHGAPSRRGFINGTGWLVLGLFLIVAVIQIAMNLDRINARAIKPLLVYPVTLALVVGLICWGVAKLITKRNTIAGTVGWSTVLLLATVTRILVMTGVITGSMQRGNLRVNTPGDVASNTPPAQPAARPTPTPTPVMPNPVAPNPPSGVGPGANPPAPGGPTQPAAGARSNRDFTKVAEAIAATEPASRDILMRYAREMQSLVDGFATPAESFLKALDEKPTIDTSVLRQRVATVQTMTNAGTRYKDAAKSLRDRLEADLRAEPRVDKTTIPSISGRFITQSFADARVFAVDQVMRAGEDLAAQSQLILDAPSLWSIDARGDVTSSDAKKAGEYRMYETKLFGPKRMLRGAVDRAVSP